MRAMKRGVLPLVLLMLLPAGASFAQADFSGLWSPVGDRTGQDDNPRQAVMVDTVLAMTQYRLKQTDQAQATLAQGVELANAKLSKLDEPHWNNQLTARLLMREAQALIGTIPAPGDTK